MKDFLENIRSKAKKTPKRIAFDEINDERILKAVEIIKNEKIASPVLIGNKKEIEKNASQFKVNIDGVEIIDHNEYSEEDKLIETLFKLREKKGMTKEQATELIKDPIYFATMLLYDNKIEGIVSGAANPTSRTLKPALQIIKTREGINTASSFFFIAKEKEILIFSDCAMNIQPTTEQVADIAMSSYESAKSFGVNPKIAMLSFSTHGSAKHKDCDKMIKATKIVKEKYPHIHVDGEIQFDAAYVKAVAKKKTPNSDVAGKANVFIFPDLDAGNIGYKIAERLGKYRAIGPLIQGLKKPVNDLSRGCSVEDIVDVCAITVIDAIVVENE